MAYNSKYTGEKVEEVLDSAIQSNGHVSVVETGVNDSSRSSKFETLQILTSGNRKMVYGMCTDQTSDGTGFIGGLFPVTATSFPYAGGLAIGGTSKNLIYLGKPCLTASNLTATTGKAITGFSTSNGITTFTTGTFLTEHQDISKKADVDNVYTKQEIDDIIGDIELALSKL